MLRQLCSWLRHRQATTREADARVTHLRLDERKIYHIVLLMVGKHQAERRLITIIFVANVCGITHSSVCFHRRQKNIRV